MIAQLRELWRFRELLIILVQRDLKVRYKNSILGFWWSLVNPLLMVLVITIVLKIFMRVQVENYSAYIFCALLPWLFFQLALEDSCDSLVQHEGLLKKVYFPREVIPLARVISNLIHFLLAAGVFLVYLALLPVWWWLRGGEFSWAIQPTLVFAPVVMLFLFLLATGLGLTVAALNLFYEDVRYLITAGLRILYFMVPVLYFPEMVREQVGRQLYTLYMLNPVSPLISAFRKWMLPPTQIDFGDRVTQTTGLAGSDVTFLLLAGLVSVAVAVAGYAFFNSRKWRFAERP